MSQVYRATPPDATTNILQDNIDQINNDEALRSLFSGTSFPTSPAPVIGQPCYRTDEKLLYIYTADGWVEASQIGSIPNEVKVARGIQNSLNSRLSVSLNDDGSLKSPATANVSEWKETGLAVTRVDGTSFEVDTDQTAIFTKYRKLKVNTESSHVIMHVTDTIYDSINDKTIVYVSEFLPATLASVDYGLVQNSVPAQYVVGPESSVDGGIAVFDGTTGKVIKGAGFRPRSPLNSPITVTVGSGGDFPTINAALAHVVSTYYPIYLSTAMVPRVTIQLLSGFVMSEQVLIESLDLSWITITGADAETVINRSALTTYWGECYPAFGVMNGGFLPIIGQLFNMDTSGTAVNRHGIIAYSNSRAIVLDGCGVKNAGSFGIYALHGSIINARGANASGAGSYGIYAHHGSTINARGANASGAGINGISAVASSTINATSADASGAGSNGIYASYGSTINATSANASGAGSNGIWAASGSTISADDADASGAGSNGIYVNRGSIINARSVTGTLSQTANTITGNGIIFQ